MTKRECAIVEAYTGICMLAGNDRCYLYRYLEEICGEPIWTHELYTRSDEIQEKSRPDFIKLCATAADEF